MAKSYDLIFAFDETTQEEQYQAKTPKGKEFAEEIESFKHLAEMHGLPFSLTAMARKAADQGLHIKVQAKLKYKGES